MMFFTSKGIIPGMTSISRWFQIAIHKLMWLFAWRQLLIATAILMVIGWLFYTPDGLLGKADAIGYAVCHRIDTRSFHLGDRQIPVCARCTGQYLGAVLGLTFFIRVRPHRTGRPSWTIIGILIAFVSAYTLDGLNSYIHLIPNLSRFYLYEPSNLLRLVTGTGLGIGLSVMLYPAFSEVIWKQRDARPVLEGIRDFSILLVLGAIVDLLVLIENPLILYPLALISAGGILMLLTMVYTMVVVMVFKSENTYENKSQLVIPLIAGFIIALTQIAVLDFLRFLMTGTWEGFHFG
jgi:uncharacterized membrane protein